MVKNFEGIRTALLEKYSLDINNAGLHFSTRNYAFVFTMDYCSVVIRVSPIELRTREEVLSEFMWVDDLKRFHTTVCQPFTSSKNKPIEEFEVNGDKYRATLFRRAEGKVLWANEWNNRYFYNVGRSLGLLHKASADGNAQGFHYKRCHWFEKATYQFENFGLPSDVLGIMNETKAQVKAIAQTPAIYGMIHGDYWPGNYFTDGDNTWVFDFDDCSYGYFIYDIATPLTSWIQDPLFMPDVKRHDLLYKSGMLDEFKRGYCENYQLPSEIWDKLELFLKMRYMEQLTIMVPIDYKIMVDLVGYDMVELDKKIVLAKDDFWSVLDELAQSKKEGNK